MAEEKAGGEGWQKISVFVAVLILLGFLFHIALNNLPTIASLLMLVIGIGGAFSIGFFGWGILVYLLRLGNENRNFGLWVLEWSVTLLFVVIVAGALLRLVERGLS